MRVMRGYRPPPADGSSSPKKSSASRGAAAGPADLRRETAVLRRYVFWGLVALVLLCYVLRQVFYSAPARAARGGAESLPLEEREQTSGGLETGAKPKESVDDSALAFLPFKKRTAAAAAAAAAAAGTIKPANYDRDRGRLAAAGNRSTDRSSASPKARMGEGEGEGEGDDDDDGDFGVAEDNNRPEEQLWTAPPAPPPPPPKGPAIPRPSANSSAG